VANGSFHQSAVALLSNAGLSPANDIHATSEDRQRIVEVLLGRCLRDLLQD
jgi:hypothetical protein